MLSSDWTYSRSGLKDSPSLQDFFNAFDETVEFFSDCCGEFVGYYASLEVSFEIFTKASITIMDRGALDWFFSLLICKWSHRKFTVPVLFRLPANYVNYLILFNFEMLLHNHNLRGITKLDVITCSSMRPIIKGFFWESNRALTAEATRSEWSRTPSIKPMDCTCK